MVVYTYTPQYDRLDPRHNPAIVLMDRLFNLHHTSECGGRPCVFHNPSDHHMITWSAVWRTDLKIVERICKHGFNHPDVDVVDYFVGKPRSNLLHACCISRCCFPPERKP